jgi:transposase-like protein
MNELPGVIQVVCCPTCGAQYRAVPQHIMMRDKDEYRCEDCNAKVYQWNGSTNWTFTRLPDKAKP